MVKRLTLFIMIAIISMVIFTNILPYPIFSNYTNITEQNMYDIANAKEMNEEREETENNIAVLTLDWEAVNPLLEIGNTYEVIDIKSGKSFYATRTNGKNHADIEPIDIDNAKILKSVYSNNLTWTRRAVFVKLTDYVYLSASISGYPHGDYSIENGLDGHICLHFLNSKTDTTKTEDSKHQECIRYAKRHAKSIYKLIAD